MFRRQSLTPTVFGLLGMVDWLYKWYDPRGRWGAEESSSAFLSMVESWRRPSTPEIDLRHTGAVGDKR